MLSCRISSRLSQQLSPHGGQLFVRSCCLTACPLSLSSSRQRLASAEQSGQLPLPTRHTWLLLPLPACGQTRNFCSSIFRLSDQTVLAATATQASSATSASLTAPSDGGGASTVAPSDGGGASTVAASDGGGASSQELILDFLPERPAPVDPTVLLGEPTLESLGLASWWPKGRLQYFMEQLHVGLGMEWYQAIALTTVCLRFLTFPLVVMAQRNVANMSNNTPGMAALQQKMTEARRRGDHMEVAQYGAQLQTYMKKKGINPLKNVVPMAAQMPIFMSMFLGLRSMANLPVPSMETGGILWFENLCMADPFYLLPILTSTTLYIQIRMGAEGARLNTMGPMGRIFFTVFPFALLPITMNFPCAVTFYWFCTNVVSCTQAAILRLPAVRAKLNIPKLNKFDAQTMQGPKQGFRESVRETIDNWRVHGDIIDRRAQDEEAFREAGTAKLQKTYAYDPTKPVAIKRR